MRCTAWGLLISLVLLCSHTAMAQVSGEVRAVGFDGMIRQSDWTPMKVVLTPETTESGPYLIRVIQRDLDGDEVSYVRRVTVTGGTGPEAQQTFWTYFQPTPLKGGMARGGGTPGDMRVLLTRPDGEPVNTLRITAQVRDIDATSSRGERLILMVTPGNVKISEWALVEVGVKEVVLPLNVLPQDLPDHPLGYDAVDAVILHTDAVTSGVLAEPGQVRDALITFVRRGGRLVLIQGKALPLPAWLAALSPVKVTGMEEITFSKPLLDLIESQPTSILSTQTQQWQQMDIKVRVATATAKPGTIVDQHVVTEQGTATPWLARHALGYGCVTWVGQDLALLPSRSPDVGWSIIWNAILDYHDKPFVDRKRGPVSIVTGNVGDAIDGDLNLTDKSAVYVSLAALLFIVYGLVAGPGLQAVLVAQKKSHLSWFIFGGIAAAATGLALLMVWLVLGGAPDMRHFTIVRQMTDGSQEPLVVSRFGLYVPRDGRMKLELAADPQERVNVISPYPIDPAKATEALSGARRSYEVYPIDPPPDADEHAAVFVPYRTTLKKLEAQYTGELPPASLSGQPYLNERGELRGKLFNATGHSLRSVYLCYREAGRNRNVYLVYIRDWGDQSAIDLETLTDNPDAKAEDRTPLAGTSPFNANMNKLRGAMPRWSDDIYEFMGRGGATYVSRPTWSWDVSADNRLSNLIMSLHDSLDPDRPSNLRSMVEITRFGLRDADVSAAVSAGNLIILADVLGPTPLPLTVEDRAVQNSGRTLYQFVMPLDRSKVNLEPETDSAASDDANTGNAANNDADASPNQGN